MKAANLIAFALLAFQLQAAEEVPKPLLDGLAAEDFAVREKSQQELFGWAKENPGERAGSLLALSEGEDPEIRMRSLQVMRQLSDEDYLSDGKGYLGINMLEESLQAAPDDKPGFGIRVMNVVRDSPAHATGIKAGDLIIALDGQKWEKEGAMNTFMEQIAQKKPLDEVVLTVRRDAAEPADMTVKLGRRPIEDLRTAFGDMRLLDQKAKDEHFKDWMKRLKAGKD